MSAEYDYLHSWSSFWTYVGGGIFMAICMVGCLAMISIMAVDTYHRAREHDLTEQGWFLLEERGGWCASKQDTATNTIWHTGPYATKREAVGHARTMIRRSAALEAQLKSAMDQHD